MDTMLEKKNSLNELQNKIHVHLEELIQATDKARISQEMLRFFDFCGRFHQYSANNIWLILMQCPHATHVAGFQKWKSMKRWVRKGEQGIAVLAPLLIKEDEKDGLEKQSLVGFKTVFVFDVTQTEGAPLPPVPDWKSPAQNAILQSKLIRFAQNQKISISVEALPGECQGLSMGGRIKLSPDAGTKTLVHELGHELLHRKPDAPVDRATREAEAESVAYAVCKYYGLDQLNSPNYLALWGLTSEQLNHLLDRIHTTVSEIISALELLESA